VTKVDDLSTIKMKSLTITSIIATKVFYQLVAMFRSILIMKKVTKGSGEDEILSVNDKST
jgi:hypothetical protein